MAKAALIMHERAKHFSIHHLFPLLKVQFIKCSAAARGDGGGDMDDQAQRSVTRAAEVLNCHLIMCIIQYITTTCVTLCIPWCGVYINLFML